MIGKAWQWAKGKLGFSPAANGHSNGNGKQRLPEGKDGSYVAGQVSGPSSGILQRLRQEELPWTGPETADKFETGHNLERERFAGGPRQVVFPWFPPYQDDGSVETGEMRIAYRRMSADPTVSGALKGLIYAVSSLDLKIIPADRKSKFDQDVADFVRWNLTERLADGFAGLVWSILSGGLTDGFSLNYKVFGHETHGRYSGKWPLRILKPVDVGNDAVLQTDAFRNIVGVLGLRYNGGLEFSPNEFVIYRHCPMYNNPNGTSALRCVYQDWWFLKVVNILRGKYAEFKSGPLTFGEYENTSQQKQLNSFLQKIRSTFYGSVPKGVELKVLDIAGSADAVFKSFCDDKIERIVYGIQHATLQALTGGQGEQRGSSDVHKKQTDLVRKNLACGIESSLNDFETGLIPDICNLNFVMTGGYPRAVLEAIDPEMLEKRQRLLKGLQEMGLKLSKTETYDGFSIKPPEDDDDVLEAAQPGGGQPGGPGEQPPGEGEVPPGQPPETPPEAGQEQGQELPGSEETLTPLEFAEYESFYEDDWKEIAPGKRGGKRWQNTKGRIVSSKVNPDAGKKRPEPKVKPEKPQKPAKPTVDEVHDRIKAHLASGQAMSKEEVASVATHIASLTGAQVTELKKRLDVKASGNKTKMAGQIAERALAKAAAVTLIENPKHAKAGQILEGLLGKEVFDKLDLDNPESVKEAVNKALGRRKTAEKEPGKPPETASPERAVLEKLLGKEALNKIDLNDHEAVKAALTKALAGQQQTAPKAEPESPADPAKPEPVAPSAPPQIDINDPQALADAVHEAGRSIPAAVGGRTNTGNLPLHDSHKPLVADVYDALKDRLGGVSLDEFKQAMMAAHQAGKVEMGRLDMPQAVPEKGGLAGFERSSRSEIRHPGGVGTFHTVNTNSEQARKRNQEREKPVAPPAPEQPKPPQPAPVAEKPPVSAPKAVSPEVARVAARVKAMQQWASQLKAPSRKEVDAALDGLDLARTSKQDLLAIGKAIGADVRASDSMKKTISQLYRVVLAPHEMNSGEQGDITSARAADIAAASQKSLADFEKEGAAAAPTPTPAASSPQHDHATLAAAFQRLAADPAKHGQISLADLSDATGLKGKALHDAVNHLRRDGVLTGSPSEARHGNDPREMEHAIPDPGGNPITHVSLHPEGKEALAKLANGAAPAETPKPQPKREPAPVPQPPPKPPAPAPKPRSAIPDDKMLRVKNKMMAAPKEATEAAERLPAGLKEAVRKYTIDEDNFTGEKSVYREINRALKGRGEMGPEAKKVHEDLQKAFAMMPVLSTPVLTYRSERFRDENAAKAFLASAEESLKSGKPMGSGGYQSSTRMPGIAINGFEGEHGLLMEISARHGIEADQLAHQDVKGEGEFLMPPGTRYRVVGIKDVPFRVEHGKQQMQKVVQVEQVVDEPTDSTASLASAAEMSAQPTVSPEAQQHAIPDKGGNPITHVSLRPEAKEELAQLAGGVKQEPKAEPVPAPQPPPKPERKPKEKAPESPPKASVDHAATEMEKMRQGFVQAAHEASSKGQNISTTLISRDELNRRLEDLGLDKMSKLDLLALAKKIDRAQPAGSSKEHLLKTVKNHILAAHEMMAGANE